MKLTDLMQAKGIGKTPAPPRRWTNTQLPRCSCHHHCGDVPEEDDFWSACRGMTRRPDTAA